MAFLLPGHQDCYHQPAGTRSSLRDVLQDFTKHYSDYVLDFESNSLEFSSLSDHLAASMSPAAVALLFQTLAEVR